MAVRFSTREDGQVDATLGDKWPIFNEAHGDSISSLPPRGASGNGPSTCWIDVAAEGAKRAAASGDDRPFTCGDITLLRLRDGQVVASFDFADDDEPGEAMALDEFLGLLAEWRECARKRGYVHRASTGDVPAQSSRLSTELLCVLAGSTERAPRSAAADTARTARSHVRARAQTSVAVAPGPARLVAQTR